MLGRIALVLALLTPAVSSAEETFTLGARATGMGGAFTAVAEDSTAFYWNPAGVARGPFVRLGFYGGRSFQDRGELVDRLQADQPGEGSVLDGDRAFGFSAGLTVLGVAVTRFTQSSSFLDGDELRSRGLERWDVAASFVQSLPWLDDLVLGFNLRFIRGTAHEETLPAEQVPESDRSVDALVERAVSGPGKTENEPGFDLGVLYRPGGWIVRLGLSARNLNRPTFHTLDGNEIVLARHVRAGTRFDLSPTLIVATDVDLSARNEPVGDAGWREVAAGVEKSWGAGRFFLRGGLRAELSEGSLSRPGISGGVGFTMGGFTVELAGITGTERRLGSLWLGVHFTR